MSAIPSIPALHDYSTTRGKKGREWKGEKGLSMIAETGWKFFKSEKIRKDERVREKEMYTQG